MRYLGIDVHSKATVWCLLDQTGEVIHRGKVPTTRLALRGLVAELADKEALRVGQVQAAALLTSGSISMSSAMAVPSTASRSRQT